MSHHFLTKHSVLFPSVSHRATHDEIATGTKTLKGLSMEWLKTVCREQQDVIIVERDSEEEEE
jgi:hypothetical protein